MTAYAPAPIVEEPPVDPPVINWSAEKKSFAIGKQSRPYYYATPTDQFWAFYRQNKALVNGAGIGLVKEGESFVIICGSKTQPKDFAWRIAMSRASDTTFEPLAPRGLHYLQYQKAGIQYARGGPNVLFGDDMGLGKTIQAIGVCNDDPTIRKVLLVVPAYLKLNWRNEIAKWYCLRPYVIEIFNAGEEVQTHNGGGESADGLTSFTIINYDILARYELDKTSFDALICDEGHYIKNVETKRAKAVFAIKARRIMILTGTPALNRSAELYSPYKLLMGKRAMGWWQFAKRYCDGKKGPFGFEAKGSTNSDELQALLRGNFMVRRLKSDVLKDLPAKMRQNIVLAPDSKVKLVIDEENQKWSVHEETLAELNEKRADAAVSEDDEGFAELGKAIQKVIQVAFQEMAILRLNLAKHKVPLVAAHVTNLLDDTAEKVIVFFHHKEPLKQFAELMAEYGVGVVDGDLSANERQPIVDRFQKDPSLRIIAGTIGAMGTGFTLTAAQNVVFAELDWRPGILAQAEDRAHRIGQEGSVLCQYLLFDDSLDLKMIGSVISKMEALSGVLNKEITSKTENVTAASPIAPDKPKTRKLHRIPQNLQETVHEALKFLASNDTDRARSQNNIGFNKIDSRVGHKFAEKDYLNNNEASYAYTFILRKYRNQLPREMFRILWPDDVDRDPAF